LFPRARSGGAIVALLPVACEKPAQQQAPAGPVYQASWESLTRHAVPEWLLDAKFGIYAHWGVYSVPAYGNEWYGKLMYDPTNRRNVYQHHLQTYGGPAKFGYREFIPRFNAEKFDPAAWADVIRRSGAKYAGIAVVHHDGFCLWASKVNRWNAGNMGPHRDLYGDLVKALRAEGLKTIATFHHIRTFNWYLPTRKEDVEKGKKEGWDLFDPEYADFYWNESTSTYEEFLEVWKAKVNEVIDTYHPDVVWFDGGKFREQGAEQEVTTLLAHYLNQGAAGGQQVEVLNKLPTSMKFNFPREFGMLTFEAGRDRPEKVDRPWTDDLSIGIGSWGYVTGLKYRQADRIVDGLVDRVSRGGGLLLSLAPKADGTLPQEQQEILLGIGDWLKVNGEAIYATRPWRIHAEGPLDKLMTKRGGHVRWSFENCSAEDIRFTRKGNTLYAITLGWPEGGKLTIKTLGTKEKISEGGIAAVSMLGVPGELKWSRDEQGLTITLPAEPPCKDAYAFKIEVKGTLI